MSESNGQQRGAQSRKEGNKRKRKPTSSPAELARAKAPRLVDSPANPATKRKENTSSKDNTSRKSNVSSKGNAQRSNASQSKAPNRGNVSQANNARAKARSKQHAARTIAAQTSTSAFSHGELNTAAFVNARAFEIDALESAMRRSKVAGTSRAFQAVPRELRRRGASHDVRRVPKRLRHRAKREMKEDNTPSRKSLKVEREKSGKGRVEKGKRLLRKDIATQLKRLGMQARTGGTQKKKRKKPLDGAVEGSECVPTVASEGDVAMQHAPDESAPTKTSSKKRADRRAKLAKPPLPAAKFRKRQIHKAWLPTHLYHAKRAHMTPPKQPLWRMAIPLTPTEKSYRASHRATMQAGALLWDKSYVSTVRIEGVEAACLSLLRGLGIGIINSKNPTERGRWLAGSRAWQGWAFERESPHLPIAPVTIVWSANISKQNEAEQTKKRREARSLFIRVHPSAFRQLWEEIVRLSKVVKPNVAVEDLRFEIGSIEIKGPGAGETLSMVLRPSLVPNEAAGSEVSPLNIMHSAWDSLGGVTNLSALPANAVFALDISDPRLQLPTTTAKPLSQGQFNDLQRKLAFWPLDASSPHESDIQSPQSKAIFDRKRRQTACRLLPSQKAINRRRTLAPPGSYPASLPSDPRIPILAFVHRENTMLTSMPNTKRAGPDISSITLLAPWKCIRTLWYCLMFYHLSTGRTPRFGGLQETRQTAFETCTPWFPGDYPGTAAGKVWEEKERQQRKDAWERKPKARRVEWDTLDLGHESKGEIGLGWACDWDALVAATNPPSVTSQEVEKGEELTQDVTLKQSDTAAPNKQPNQGAASSPNLVQLTLSQASTKLNQSSIDGSVDLHELCAIKICMVSRGYPTTCARIYRLPQRDEDLRKRWLKLLDRPQRDAKKTTSESRRLIDKYAVEPDHASRQRLAQGLLAGPARHSGIKAGDAEYPTVPRKEDLIGFVTTGNFNLGEGKPTAMGNILLRRVADNHADWYPASHRYLCIVRDAGQRIGRLARWELV